MKKKSQNHHGERLFKLSGIFSKLAETQHNFRELNYFKVDICKFQHYIFYLGQVPLHDS